MQQIEAVGFDMDFTLAQYTEAFDKLAYEGAKEKLVNAFGYPKEVMDLKYNSQLCRRGCLIDKSRGNVIKLDASKYVRVAEHGLTPLSSAERKSTYRNMKNDWEKSKNFVNIDTPFSLVDASLYMQLVDLVDRMKDTFSKSYEQVFADMRSCVDRCHKDGVIKLKVAQEPSKYIVYDPNIFPMLDSFRKAGRKTFLLTNSLWDYSMVVMNYLEARKTGKQKDLAWTNYFDVIIVGGNKPAFLVDDRGSLALFRVDPKDESLTNVDSLPESNSLSSPSSVGGIGGSSKDSKTMEDFLRQGKTFQGGNAHMLHSLLQIKSSDRILYVGDHVYADILRSKRTHGWRTCLIVPELTEESELIPSFPL
jgi:HAD superfamily 5'-nucleotidase-like hydrolase